MGDCLVFVVRGIRCVEGRRKYRAVQRGAGVRDTAEGVCTNGAECGEPVAGAAAAR